MLEIRKKTWFGIANWLSLAGKHMKISTLRPKVCKYYILGSIWARIMELLRPSLLLLHEAVSYPDVFGPYMLLVRIQHHLKDHAQKWRRALPGCSVAYAFTVVASGLVSYYN